MEMTFLRTRLQEIMASREVMQRILTDVTPRGEEGRAECAKLTRRAQLWTQTTKSAKTTPTVETQHAPSLIERVITETLSV